MTTLNYGILSIENLKKIKAARLRLIKKHIKNLAPRHIAMLNDMPLLNQMIKVKENRGY